VLKALYGTNLVANNVIVRLPTPGNTARVKVAATVGKAKYKGEEGAVIWKYGLRQRTSLLRLVQYRQPALGLRPQLAAFGTVQCSLLHSAALYNV
jgi:hypothetical protein